MSEILITDHQRKLLLDYIVALRQQIDAVYINTSAYAMTEEEYEAHMNAVGINPRKKVVSNEIKDDVLLLLEAAPEILWDPEEIAMALGVDSVSVWELANSGFPAKEVWKEATGLAKGKPIYRNYEEDDD